MTERPGVIKPTHTKGRPIFKGEPSLIWVIERHRHNGEVAMVGIFRHALATQARVCFDENIAACGGDGSTKRARGVRAVQLQLVLTDDSGYEHDVEVVDEWKESE
jgi:hypothetical protein